LADRKGYAIFIGTPKGKNEFYRLYEKSKHKENWLGILLTVDDTKLIPEQELKDSREIMTEDEYLQEWFCSFEASIKGAYYAKEIARAREDKRITSVPFEPTLEVHTFWDLGISDYTVIGFFQIYGREIRLIRVYANHGYGLDHYVSVLQELREDKGYIYGKHNFPHDIEVRELGSGKSRKEILKTLGVKVDVVKNLHIEEGINAGRLLFKELWIDENNCLEFIDAISQYRQEWDDKKGCFKNRPLYDWTSHFGDMYRYSAIGLGDVMKDKKVMVHRPKIIRRV